MAATLSRATGRSEAGLAAVERAVRAAERSADDELRVPAYTLHARVLGDEGRSRAARDAIELAWQAERRLSAHVPEDSVGAWSERRTRVELERVTRFVSDQLEQPPARAETRERTHERDAQALGDQLTNQAAAAGADGQA